MRTDGVDVVIVGAGPNGLLMATELALAGVRPLVVDREVEPALDPRARGMVGRVVQALDYRGLYELFSGDTAAPVPESSFMFGGMRFDLTSQGDHGLFALVIPQLKVEKLLAHHANGMGVEIRRGHEVTALRQDPDQVALTIHGPTGDYELTSQFVVGADGANSLVRHQCGINFPGITDTNFIGRLGTLALPPITIPGTTDVQVPGLGRLQRRNFTRTEHGVFAFEIDNDTFLAIVYEWSKDAVEDRADDPSEELGAAVNRVLGTDIAFSPPRKNMAMPLRRVIATNSRQAEHYRQARVFLVGDAAHVYLPIGGPGLNLGMQDVFNLGWKLAAHLRGWAPEGLLDSYHTERHPVGARVIMFTRANTALLGPGPYITALGQVMRELLARDPGNAGYLGDLLSGADAHYDMHGIGADHPLTGHWMPDLPLHTPHGTTRIAELMRIGHPILLDLADRADLISTATGWTDRLKTVTATTTDPVAEAVLIRPDGYVAWAAHPDTPQASTSLRHALRTWFGQPNTVHQAPDEPR
jgi:2-polyprenyl-6-methoxyphenol hydroxylase-like FAD-dependent oxidoreductase